MSTSDTPHTKDNEWSSEQYRTNASFVYSSAFTSPVLDLLDPRPGEKVLDLGCGTGELTLKIVDAVTRDGKDGMVVGVDKSDDMVSGATKLAGSSNLSGAAKESLEFEVVDGEKLVEWSGAQSGGKGSGYDAVFTNAALHWMKDDPRAVVKGVRKVLKEGGRFVGECGGFMNIIGIRMALLEVLKARGKDAKSFDPWYFPSVAEYRKLLEDEGFEVKYIELIPRPTSLPTGLSGWLKTFATVQISAFATEDEKEAVIQEICDRCEIDMFKQGEGWTAMYCRLRFQAVAR